jgi:hypothetical protein
MRALFILIALPIFSLTIADVALSEPKPPTDDKSAIQPAEVFRQRAAFRALKSQTNRLLKEAHKAKMLEHKLETKRERLERIGQESRLRVVGFFAAIAGGVAALLVVVWLGLRSRLAAMAERRERILRVARLAVGYARQTAKREGWLADKPKRKKCAVTWAQVAARTKEHRVRGRVDWGEWVEVALGERHLKVV